MERNRGLDAAGLQLRSRLGKRTNVAPRGSDAWPSRCDPRSRLDDVALRANGFDRFARGIERDLDPRGPLERIVTRHAARSAWRLQEGLDDAARAGDSVGPADAIEAAARSLGTAIRTLNLLQDRPVDASEPAPPSECIDGVGREADQANEWPVVPSESVLDSSWFASEPVESAAPEPPIWQGRLVYDFDVSDHSPVVRGTWITVSHVVSLVVDGATWADILRSHPELTEDDIRVCVAYAVAEDDAGL